MRTTYALLLLTASLAACTSGGGSSSNRVTYEPYTEGRNTQGRYEPRRDTGIESDGDNYGQRQREPRAPMGDPNRSNRPG